MPWPYLEWNILSCVFVDMLSISRPASWSSDDPAVPLTVSRDHSQTKRSPPALTSFPFSVGTGGTVLLFQGILALDTCSNSVNNEAAASVEVCCHLLTQTKVALPVRICQHNKAHLHGALFTWAGQ